MLAGLHYRGSSEPAGLHYRGSSEDGYTEMKKDDLITLKL
jgi:hypothetical protein